MHQSATLRAAFDSVSAAVLVLQGDTIIHTNPAMQQLVGTLTHSALRADEWFHPEDLPQLYSNGSDPQNQFELRFIHPSLEGCTASVAVSSLIWEHTPALALTILDMEYEPDVPSRQDILMRSVFDAAGIGIILVNEGGRILQANLAFQRLLGYDQEDLRHRTFIELTHPDDTRIEAVFLRELLTGQRDHYQIETRYIRRDGSTFWSRVTASVIQRTSGQRGVFMRMVENINARKELEQELIKSLSVLRATLEATKDGVVVVDTQGETVAYNRAFEIMWRLPEDWRNLKTRAERVALLADQVEDREAFLTRVAELYAQPDVDGYDLINLKDGSVFERYSTPYHVNGRYGGRVWNFRDLTDRLRAENALFEQEKLRLALAQEQELNTLKNNLMLTIAHEFRTPLAIIMSAAELIERYAERIGPEKRRDYTDQIRQQVQHFVEMLDDMTIVVQGQSQPRDLNLSRWDMFAVCRTWIEEIQQTIGQDYHFIYDGDAAAYPVLADQTLLRRVVLNLVSNAIKYTAPGTAIAIHLSAAHGELVLQVMDDGIGIPADDLPHIFEPFYRSRNVGAVHGTGMGLAIVRDYVERHGGTIVVESKEMNGTAFTIWLPILVES